MLEQGTIILAPFKQTFWPAKIVSVGMMAEVQIYKLKLTLKVPIKSLKQYTPLNVKVLLRMQDKTLTSAIKMADKELAERLKNQNEVKKERDNGKGVKFKIEAIQPEKQGEMPKRNQAFKKQEEEDVSFQNQIVSVESFSHFLFQMNESQLISKAKTNAVLQITFYHTESRQTQKYERDSKMLLRLLTEQLLTKVWFAQNRSAVLSIEKRLKNIFDSWNIDAVTMLNSDICKLVNLTLRQKEKYPWLTNSYIQALQRFKQKMRMILEAYHDDYSKIGPFMNLICNLGIKNHHLIR